MNNDIPSESDIKITHNTIQIDRSSRKASIIIKSETTEGRAYKIKTTHPKQYIVEPSMGIIMPFQETNINVKLNVLGDELINNLNLDEHKFKIELYKFDWRRSVDNLKMLLKDSNVKHLERKLDVEIVGSYFKKGGQVFEMKDYVTLAFLGIFFLLFSKVILFE